MEAEKDATQSEILEEFGRLFESSRGAQDDLELLRMASADMERLAGMTGEAVAMALLVGDEAVYVDVVGEGQPLSEQRKIAQRVPFWKSAIGKVLAAPLPRDVRQSLLNAVDGGQLAGSGFSDQRAFVAHLDLIQARGYALEVNELGRSVSAVAAPIIDRSGRPIAAIAIEGPSNRLPREKLHELGPAVIDATRAASRHAGGTLRPTSSSPRPSTAPSPAVRVLVDTRNVIGESPVYDAAGDRLFWVDMYDPAIFRFDRKSRKLTSFAPGEMVTAIALVPEGMLAAAQSGVWLIDPDTGRQIRSFGHPERHIPSNRFNDGACDSRNRFWVNTVDMSFGANAGALYRMDPDGTFVAMETGLTVPNGMGWSPDNRTMYLVDTAARTIYAYDFSEEAGTISNRRTFARVSENSVGAPDGLAVDAKGNLWVAMFDGWRLSQFSPQGVLIGEIVMPVPRPTSCAFGRDYKTLFVTSARIRVSEIMLKEAPSSGAVFEIAL